MLVGVTSSVWLYSSKTVVSWRRFIERLQGTGGGGGGGVGGGHGVANVGTSALGNLGTLGNGLAAGSANASSTTKTNMVRTRGQAYV